MPAFITYALTVTIKPSHYKDDLTVQYSKAKEEFERCPFLLSLVSEVTKSCNLHFHGTVQTVVPKRGTAKQDIHNYFRKCKYLGFIYLKELTEPRKWYQYCFKEYDITAKDLYFAPVVILNNVIDFPHGLEIIEVKTFRHETKDIFIDQFKAEGPSININIEEDIE